MPSPSDSTLDAVASDWVARRDRGLLPNEARALEAWLAVPRHTKAFADCEAVWAALARLEPLRAVGRPRGLVQRGRALAVTTAVALAAAACVTAGIFLNHSPIAAPAAVSSSLILVAPSDGSRLVLPDGSVAFLRAGSRARYAQMASARRLMLEEGEVHVTVAKSSSLPFFVDTRDVIVRDIGTAFDVRIAPDGVGVTVTEGEVRLNAAGDHAATSSEPVRLVRGQKAWVMRGSGVAQISVWPALDETLPSVLAWKSRRLVFDGEPLSEVVRQINRLNVVQLVIDDPALASKPIAGAMQSDNLDGIVYLLRTGFGIKAQTRGNEIRLMTAP